MGIIICGLNGTGKSTLHLFLFLQENFRGRCGSCESHLPLFGIIYFPTTPFPYLCFYVKYFAVYNRKIY